MLNSNICRNALSCKIYFDAISLILDLMVPRNQKNDFKKCTSPKIALHFKVLCESKPMLPIPHDVQIHILTGFSKFL